MSGSSWKGKRTEAKADDVADRRCWEKGGGGVGWGGDDTPPDAPRVSQTLLGHRRCCTGGVATPGGVGRTYAVLNLTWGALWRHPKSLRVDFVASHVANARSPPSPLSCRPRGTLPVHILSGPRSDTLWAVCLAGAAGVAAGRAYERARRGCLVPPPPETSMTRRGWGKSTQNNSVPVPRVNYDARRGRRPKRAVRRMRRRPDADRRAPLALCLRGCALYVHFGALRQTAASPALRRGPASSVPPVTVDGCTRMQPSTCPPPRAGRGGLSRLPDHPFTPPPSFGPARVDKCGRPPPHSPPRRGGDSRRGAAAAARFAPSPHLHPHRHHRHCRCRRSSRRRPPAADSTGSGSGGVQ